MIQKVRGVGLEGSSQEQRILKEILSWRMKRLDVVFDILKMYDLCVNYLEVRAMDLNSPVQC